MVSIMVFMPNPIALSNFAEAAAAWEQLAMSRKDDLTRLQDDLDDAKNALEAMTLERDTERDTRLWTARQVGVIERLAREAIDAQRHSDLERQLKASLLIQAVIQLAEATRSQRSLSVVQEALADGVTE